MSTIRFTGEVGTDGKIHLPEGVKLAPGKVDVTLVQSPDTADDAKEPRKSLADWAEQYAEHWGNRLSAANVSSFTGRSV
ncbi:MAG: hypothetical protein A2W31_10860 [Planctomycetes bacterium RBG_16_64_10]|nr:MAG: hypothetical protein A2W31_10860 [Planctomycetes bacterium RBG_16_64_10]